MIVRRMLLFAAAAVPLVVSCGPATPDYELNEAQDTRIDLQIGDVRFHSRHIASVTQSFSESGEPVAVLRFTPSGRVRLRRALRDRVGQVFEIRVDGELISSPILMEPIEGSQFQIAGNMSLEDAERLAARLTPRQNRR